MSDVFVCVAGLVFPLGAVDFYAGVADGFVGLCISILVVLVLPG